MNGRRTRALLAIAFGDIERVRLDIGWSRRMLAARAGISPGYLSAVLAGDREPSVAVLEALASALGGDLSIRLYPNTGPAVRDRFQARIVEAVLRIAAPTWRPAVEVAVRYPARGSIDLVLDSPARGLIVASEIHSRIDRVEQLLRWAGDKAASLPSSDLWRTIDDERRIDRLLIIRSTADTREVARRFEQTLSVAYPARSADVVDSLTSDTAPWPGAGILWVDVRADEVRILDRPPRGVALGR